MSTKETGPTTTEFLLGLDIGTSRTKAVLLDAGGGGEAGAATVATPFVTTDGRVEMPVDALLGCLHEVLASMGDARRQVVAVGVAGIAESGVPLDDTGRPLAPVIAWHDERGAEAVALLEQEFGPDLALRNGQPPNTKMTAAKLGWLVAHGGVRGMHRWLGVPELALRALTGVEATEHSLAARTGCYDVVDRQWMPDVAGALGFSTAAFAPVHAAGSVMGRVSAEGGAWSGLPEGVPVTIAGHDHLAGMAGAGAGPDDVANSVGTAETVAGRTATVPDMAAAVASRAAVSVYPGGTEWAVMVSAARAGPVIEEAAASLGLSPAACDALSPDDERGRIWAGVLAGLTDRTADAYRRLTGVIGPRSRVVVFGGGSVSEPWLRAKAAALPVPVVRSTVTSAVARGAAVHAGVAAGWWPSEGEAPAPVRPRASGR
jgi:xylulokinase